MRAATTRSQMKLMLMLMGRLYEGCNNQIMDAIDNYVLKYTYIAQIYQFLEYIYTTDIYLYFINYCMRAATTRSQMHSYAKNKRDSKSNISDKLHKLGCLFFICK